ncbi:MAG: OmpA family protein [Deltaproteobacteria bacterium]|nr:OmpA family protein [Deltaproteobacteria bacterium]
MITSLLISCSSQKPLTMFTPNDVNSMFQAGQYTQKVENFIVIIDASGSMCKTYKVQGKFDLARDIVNRMNQTIPEMTLTGGLREFGQNGCPLKKKTTLVYGMTSYARSEFDDALQTVKQGIGASPLARAIDSAGNDFESAQGRMALIIVSDGKNTSGSPVASAEAIKQKFGDRLCIYTVLVGDNPGGKSVMESVAQAGRCGFSVNADQIYSSGDMAGFVEQVFLTKAARKAQLKDTDGDGVYDDRDECPGTPRGAKVDARGCWVLGRVHFDTAKSNVKLDYDPMLEEVVAVLKKNPGLKIEVRGHTDNRGAQAYNQKLSEDRAQSVVAYLVEAGIDAGRLTAVGVNFSEPIAANDTTEGLAMNRRVELAPIR